jgi:PAS domain-containing protein
MGNLLEYIEVIIGAAALLGILIKLISYIRKKLQEVFEVHQMVRTMHSEMTLNSGSSIKDKINNIDHELIEQARSIEKIKKRQFWILDNESRLIFETDFDGKFIWINKKFSDLIKRDLNFIKGFGWKNIIHDDDRDEVTSKFNKCIEDQISFEDTFRICDINGNCFRIKCLANKADECGYMGTIILLDNNDFFEQL